MKSTLVLDNYDSFTYNLVHILRELGCEDLVVVRNDMISLKDAGKFDQIVLSPGPGIPSEAGIMPRLIREFSPTKKILGVCLGHQGIGEVFGGKLKNIGKVVHGKATPIRLTSTTEPLFTGLPSPFLAGRYHSWIVDNDGFPACLEITATDDSGLIMALRHKEYNVRGVQFHPESILTEMGTQIIKNWLKI